MIIDCFSFFDNLDLLEVRLNELKDVVDIFVLSEATLTFSGKYKPLYFNENKERYEPFLDRIEHIVIDDYSRINTGVPWIMDYKQKQRGVDAMVRKYKPSGEDIVLLCDVDEIPKAEKLKEVMTEPWDVATVEMSLFYYFLNCKSQRPWKHPTWVRPNGNSINHRKLRGSRSFGKYHKTVFKDAGWHFSWLGSAEDILYKLNAHTHQEKNIPPYNTLEHINESRMSGKSIFRDRRIDETFEFTDELDYLPEYILDNIDHFKRYIHYDN